MREEREGGRRGKRGRTKDGERVKCESERSISRERGRERSRKEGNEGGRKGGRERREGGNEGEKARYYSSFHSILCTF